jgi:elongation factor P
MSLTDNLRRGAVIRHQGHLYTIIDFSVTHKGKAKPTVHVKLRDLKDNHPVDRSLDELGKIEEVPTARRTLQYLYAAGSKRVFMDAETFEEQSFDESIVDRHAAFLVEGDSYKFLTVEGNPFALEMPDVIVMEVSDTAPVEHGGATNVYKEARLKSGLMIKVPLFIKTGDRIRVKPETREYLGKEH